MKKTFYSIGYAARKQEKNTIKPSCCQEKCATA